MLPVYLQRPTKQTLLQVRITIYISNIWCNACLRSPTEWYPEDCGWTIIDNKFAHYWFDGPESPSIGGLSFNSDVFNANSGESDESEESSMSESYDSTADEEDV
ncbi:uncharacterized protein LOC108910526 [Anoplophora glabripennis]|uniref:uncharacterized protein LOC108910526 n=1 Tax=Anoplophora glabripennis TaxID=217634 RepID=UPI0008743348|nr:uncharacterized protein LOC108910526 [Anoplophora glabripennis]